jgi:hypothetical protein
VPFLLSLAAAALLISAGAQPPESDAAAAAWTCAGHGRPSADEATGC